MSLVDKIIDPVLHFHGWPAYAVIGGLVFGEAAVFIGFVLPGEVAVIIGGVLAYRHQVSLAGILITVILCAIFGDSVGYEVGRRYGNRILATKVFVKHQRAIASGRERLLRMGGKAVFIGRFTAFLRAVTPGLAGTVGMPYRNFLAWNALGGVVWAGGFTILGYLAGASYQKLEQYAGWFSWVVLGLVVAAVVVFAVRRHLKAKRAEAEPEAAPVSAESPADDVA